MKKTGKLSVITGIAAGVVLAASIYYFLKNPTGFPVWIVESIFLFVVIFILIRTVSRRFYDSQISYKAALGNGVIAVTIIAFIIGLANSFFVLEMAESKEFRRLLYESYSLQHFKEGVRGDELNKQTLLNVDSHLNPMVQFFSNFFGYFIVGLLFSLISATILRKPAKPIEFKK